MFCSTLHVRFHAALIFHSVLHASFEREFLASSQEAVPWLPLAQRIVTAEGPSTLSCCDLISALFKTSAIMSQALWRITLEVNSTSALPKLRRAFSEMFSVVFLAVSCRFWPIVQSQASKPCSPAPLGSKSRAWHVRGKREMQLLVEP